MSLENDQTHLLRDFLVHILWVLTAVWCSMCPVPAQRQRLLERLHADQSAGVLSLPEYTPENTQEMLLLM